MTFSRRSKILFKTYLKHDLAASITVFFVALPLCLGVALASGAPLYSGIVSGIVGGLIVSVISGSQLSVSGPAAGLTAICASAISDLGALEIFFLSVSVAGLLQILLGLFKLGGFTHFVPSSVIKGMLAAIGIILITKQVPLLLGYEKPDFWTDEFFNLFTLHPGLETVEGIFPNISPGAILLSLFAFGLIYVWNRFFSARLSFLPSSFVVVLMGSLLAAVFNSYVPELRLNEGHFVSLPQNIFKELHWPAFGEAFQHAGVWKYGVIIAVVATLESLLSIEAVDKLDPLKRVSPANRELVAQGSGNLISGMLGGIPITAVIVRSSANASAGAKSRWSAFTHGLWLLLVVVFAVSVIRNIPYCILAVILVRTGYNLARPVMFKAVLKQGREQFVPFVVTIGAILLTDLLIGVIIGIVYAIYFLIKHTYRAGYTVSEKHDGHIRHFQIDLALNVSFLNKQRIRDLLEKMPAYSIVEINGEKSVYIDHDILELFQEFKAVAHEKHIDFRMVNIPAVEVVDFH